jgi:hypothetical protein
MQQVEAALARALDFRGANDPAETEPTAPET